MIAASTTEAAVLRRAGEPVAIEELSIATPGPGEVAVAMTATGVCHSDIAILEGELPAPLPLVPGHEGTGVVSELGEGVVGLEVGDHVVLSWLAPCRTCFYCVNGQPYLCRRALRILNEHTAYDGSTRLRSGEEEVRQFAGVGTFARRAIVAADAVVAVPDTVPPAEAAVLGCAVITGVGAAVNTAGIRPGESVVVVGCGGVGLAAVQGARIAGATTIVAVDVAPDRLELAQRLGATDAVPAGPNVRRTVRGLTGGRGADVVIEFAGRPETLADAVGLTRPGGRVVVVSAPPPDVKLSVPAFTGVVMPAREIRGCFYGSGDVRRDIPRLVELHARGELNLAELVTDRFAFDEVGAAIEHCVAMHGGRAVVEFS